MTTAHNPEFSILATLRQASSHQVHCTGFPLALQRLLAVVNGFIHQEQPLTIWLKCPNTPAWQPAIAPLLTATNVKQLYWFTSDEAEESPFSSPPILLAENADLATESFCLILCPTLSWLLVTAFHETLKQRAYWSETLCPETLFTIIQELKQSITIRYLQK